MGAPFSTPHAEVKRTNFTELERYWRDPEYRAELHAEFDARNAERNRRIDERVYASLAAQWGCDVAEVRAMYLKGAR